MGQIASSVAFIKIAAAGSAIINLLQDQLHCNLCHQRSLVVICMHNLDSMSGPFSFNTCPLSSINFVLLKPEGAPPYNAADLLHLYKSNAECKSLKPYMPLIKDSPLYPIVLDANLTNANIILDTMVTIFSQYCASPTHSVMLHSINIAEDIDIAYGYNSTVKHVPQTCTVREELTLNLLMYLLRDEIG